jgi:hypothetical protein
MKEKCTTCWLVGARGNLLRIHERGQEWGLSKPHGGGGSKAKVAACLRTPEDVGIGQPVASCTMRAKVAER